MFDAIEYAAFIAALNSRGEGIYRPANTLAGKLTAIA